MFEDAVCPKCQEELDFISSVLWMDSNTIEQEVECPHCKWIGTASYKVEFSNYWEQNGDKVKEK